jgi:DNA-binding transcriptional ArsR family regulator
MLVKNVKKWTFLTNHAMVLNCLARSPSATAWEISMAIGIQERSTRRIIADLVEAGYVSTQKEGRRNRYAIREHLPLRHPNNSTTEVGDLLRILNPEGHKRLSGRSKESG